MSPAIEELREKRICSNCVGDPYLKAQIQKADDVETCSYCGRTAASIEIADLSQRVRIAFESHFERTPTDPDSFEYAMMNDKESTYDWEREGEQATHAIMNAAVIAEEAAEDVRAVLDNENSSFDDAAMGEETPYDSDSHYREKSPTGEGWHLEWDRFENSLRTEARFFSREAETLLASIFKDIETLKTEAGKTVVVQAGPNTSYPHLYRARVFQSQEKLAEALKNLDRELGSPPAELAIAGRMNACGISVFYGATDALTALAEIRPPVGSHVLTGQFMILRPLRLIDLAALEKAHIVGSIFDPDYVTQIERAAFFKTLGQRITRPIMPNDEALDYLVTQAIADFLATNSPNPIDGIIYRSAQTSNDARNVVLFQKAARVERFDRPYGTEIHSSLGGWAEDGWEIRYEVIESIPPADAKEPSDPVDAIAHTLAKGLYELDIDNRDVTLQLDKESMKIHEVRAVSFQTHQEKVTLFRWEKGGELPF